MGRDCFLTRPDEMALFHLALSVTRSREPDSPLPEFIFLFKPEQLMSLIKIFGGSVIRIPDAQNFRLDLLTAMWIHSSSTGKKEKWFKGENHLTDEEFLSVERRRRVWAESNVGEDV